MTALTAATWTAEQVAALTRAVNSAPVEYGHRPWRLRVLPGCFELTQVATPPAGTLDRLRRSRLISCGGAARNLALAVGQLGRRPQVWLGPHPGDPLLVARVTPTETAEPSPIDEARYRAIFHQRSRRGPLSGRPLPPGLAHRLLEAGVTAGAGLLPIAGEQLRATVSVLAVSVLAASAANQAAIGPAPPVPLPTCGRVHLAITVDDGPRDWVHAGWALQNAWLTATSHGLAGSVLAAALEAPGVRGALTERLGLAGYPQALLRLGWPHEHVAPRRDGSERKGANGPVAAAATGPTSPMGGR